MWEHLPPVVCLGFADRGAFSAVASAFANSLRRLLERGRQPSWKTPSSIWALAKVTPSWDWHSPRRRPPQNAPFFVFPEFCSIFVVINPKAKDQFWSNVLQAIKTHYIFHLQGSSEKYLKMRHILHHREGLQKFFSDKMWWPISYSRQF